MDIIESDRDNAETRLKALIKYIKNVNPRNYNVPEVFHSELLHRQNGIARIISEIKQVQWKIVNYSIVLNAALVSTSKLIPFENWKPSIVWPCITYSLLVLAIVGITVLMLRKTNFDLSYYRAHSSVNDDLLATATGIAASANMIVSKRDMKYIGTENYDLSARRNFIAFSLWFYIVTALGGVFSIGATLAILLM